MSDIRAKSDQQKDAEADVKSFHDDLGPFVVAAETTRMAMVFTDACDDANPIIFANDAFLKLTGYSRNEVLGQSFNFLMAQGADAEAVALIQAEFEGHSESGSEVRYCRKDGSDFWAAVFVSPVRNKDGDIVQHFASFLDLTAHKQEEANSRRLIDELNHRVKNTLATVQSIVWQTARANPAPKAMREAVETRLFALSRSHDLLNRRNWQSAGLRDIVRDALEPFVVTGGRVGRLIIVGDNVPFAPARFWRSALRSTSLRPTRSNTVHSRTRRDRSMLDGQSNLRRWVAALLSGGRKWAGHLSRQFRVRVLGRW